MPQAALYWPPGTPDGYGGMSDGDPEAVKVRWEDKAVLFIDPMGEEKRSSSVVYVSAEVEDQGHLTLTTLDLETATEDEISSARGQAREIVAVNKSPSLSGHMSIVKAFI